MKKVIVGVVVALFMAMTGVGIAYAKPDSNPNFPTREEVQQWITDIAGSLNQKIAELTYRVDILEGQAGDNDDVFIDDFSTFAVDTTKWTPTAGWSENLVLTVDGGEIGYTKKSDFSNFILNADFKIKGRSDYNTANFILRMTPDNPYAGGYYMIQISSKTSQFSPNSIRINRGPHILAKVIPIPMEIKNGDWHHFKIKADEYTFSFFVDGKFVGRYYDDVQTDHTGSPMREYGAFGIYAHGTPGNVFSDLVDYANLEIRQIR